MAAQHVEMTAIAGHQVHARLDDRAPLAVRADGGFNRRDDLGPGEPEALRCQGRTGTAARGRRVPGPGGLRLLGSFAAAQPSLQL